MPRAARLDTPGLLHHVIIRGIERRRIFRDDVDREDFLERLSDLLPETKTQCYAWALLPNHAHFLFRSGPQGIAALMRRLLTGHAITFNRRYKRHGQLFQNRYKSVICQEDPYFQELVRYIHLNPLRAGVVSDVAELDGYPYCGHSALTGKRQRPWQETRYVLGFFGKGLQEARRRYGLFVQKAIEMGRRPELVGGGMIRSLGGWDEVKRRRPFGRERIKSDQRILGDRDFVRETLSESKEAFSRKYRLASRGLDFEAVLRRVALLFDLETDYIIGKGRQRDRVGARDLLCYWCAVELGMTLAELARRLDLTLAAVSYAVKRGESAANEKGWRLDE
jgi:REP element-mobilizing transposase RayT